MSKDSEQRIVLGKITGLYGVRGWVKVHSFVDPIDSILEHRSWSILRGGVLKEYRVAEGRLHGASIVVRFDGFDDRDQAAVLLGSEISVLRSSLPALDDGEYYWADLEGMRVVTTTGVDLGVVDHMLETGANDVIVVVGDRQRLIPYIKDSVVVDVSLNDRVMRVDWDPEF